MAGPLRGSYNGTPYVISGDRRSGTVTVTDPSDHSQHSVAVTRTQAGRLTVTEIDGHWMSTINMMATAEQKVGIAKMIGTIHGSEAQITREINKADGVVDPAEAEAKKAKLLREAETKRQEADKLAQVEERHRADEAKRKTEPTVVEGTRDLHPEPAPVVERHDPIVPDKREPVVVDAKGVPLPVADPRKAKVTPVADTRVAEKKSEPKKEGDPKLTGNGEKHLIAEGTVKYGHGDSSGSLRLRHMKDGRTMVFRDPQTKLSELLHGPKRTAAFRALREHMGETHDAPHMRMLKFMTSVMTHLGKVENKAAHPALQRREHVVDADARPVRDLQPRDGMRPQHRTALMAPIEGMPHPLQDVARQAEAQIRRGGPKGPGFFG